MAKQASMTSFITKSLLQTVQSQVHSTDISLSEIQSSQSVSCAASSTNLIVVSSKGIHHLRKDKSLPNDDCDSDESISQIEFHNEDIDTDDSNINEEGAPTNLRKSRSSILSKKRGIRREYKQKYCDSWKSQFKWLSNKNDQSHCVYCDKIIHGSFTHMARHEKTENHKKKFLSLTQTVDFTQFLQKSDEKKIFNQRVKECELKLAMLIVEHNLPMIIMDHLPKLLVSAAPDSEILKSVHCASKKTTALLNTFKEESGDSIAKIMRESKFSLIIDETTDISVKKCLAILVRYMDFNQMKARDRLFSFVEVTESTAVGITGIILKELEKFSIPLKNAIGFAADNVNVMMGRYNGVQARLKQVNPDIFVIGCICHSFHLAASAAAKKLPNAVEDLVRDIYNYLNSSSKRLKDFKEFQDYVNCKPHKLLRPSQTRWLSLEMVVKRTLEQWGALKLFFQSAVLEDNLDAAATILNKLNDIFFKLYFTFLAYILPIITKLNLEFQSECPKLYAVYIRIETVSKTILKNFMKAEYVDRKLNKEKLALFKVNEQNVREYRDLNDIYLGVKVQEILESLDRNDTEVRQKILEFKMKCLSYYVELFAQMKQRFQNLETYRCFTCLNPTVALQNGSSAMDLIIRFPNLYLNPNDAEEISSEYREICNLPPEVKSKLESLDMQEFWVKLYEFKNAVDERCYKNLCLFIFNVMCLPHSSAAAERIFSSLTNIKTKNRNRLLPTTCNNLLQAKELLEDKNCYGWTPSRSILSRDVKYQ